MSTEFTTLTSCASTNQAETFGSAQLRHGDPILVRHLVELVDPIVNFVHQERPATILANDRGARLAGLAIFYAYRARFRQPIPTLDGKLHFAYLSKQQSDTSEFGQRLSQLTAGKRGQRDTTVLFVDDWIDTGATANRFLDTAQAAGLSMDEVAIATLCGEQLPDVRHVVGNNIYSINSEWNAYEEITGVEIRNPNQAHSYPAPNNYALAVRQRIVAAAVSHYEQAS